jgi:hypothetical protein
MAAPRHDVLERPRIVRKGPGTRVALAVAVAVGVVAFVLACLVWGIGPSAPETNAQASPATRTPGPPPNSP